MTKSKALYDFFSSFGLNAYPNSNVPDTATYPYLTYENSIGNYGDQNACQVNLWYKTNTETVPNAKAEDISNAIGIGGKLIAHDDGAIWIKRGSPWCQSLTDTDKSVKRRLLNLTLEFI